MGREVMTQAEVKVSYCLGVLREDVRGLRSVDLVVCRACWWLAIVPRRRERHGWEVRGGRDVAPGWVAAGTDRPSCCPVGILSEVQSILWAVLAGENTYWCICKLKMKKCLLLTRDLKDWQQNGDNFLAEEVDGDIFCLLRSRKSVCPISLAHLPISCDILVLQIPFPLWQKTTQP